MNRLPGFLRRKKGAKGQVVKPPSPQKQQQKDDAYVDTDGGHSDVSFMSMGDGNLSDGGESIEEQPSLVQPSAGEQMKVGPGSYTEEEFHSKSGGSAFGQDPFRLEDNKKAWDASLDADVQATAELLAEQMRANPETAVDVTDQGGEELGEFADPLGLGVLNQSTMALESADSAKAGNTRRQLKKLARWQAESTMRLGKVDSDQPQDAASALLGKLQTSSKQFDPWIYLSTAHADTPGEQLQQGLRKLESSLSARKDQMRQLVKENFQRFIGCKGTIDDISHKLRENESVSNQSGSTKNVALAAADAQRAAHEAFGPILERQAEADAVRQKLTLLQRFEALFRLPSRVQELAADKDYQGVVNEYTKGKKLVPVKDHALWKEVARRLEEETAAVCERLMAEISDTQSDYPTVIRAIQHVELLKAEGLAAAQASNPLAAFANSQREFLQQRLRFLVESHVQTVTSVVGLEASRDGQERNLHSMMPVQAPGDSSDSSSKCSTVQLAWLDLLQDLTNFFSKELKLLLMMSKSAEMAEFFTTQNKASSWKSGVKNMRNVLTEVQAHVQQELHSTLQTLWEESDKHLAAHMTALSILGTTRAAVEASGKWHDDLDILSDVAKAVLSHGVAVLEASMATWDADEDDWEMWRVHMSAASARHPVSAALASVHNGACNAMLQFSNLTKAAETLCKVTVEDVHARIAKAFLERLNDIARKMRAMLQDVRSEARAMLKAHQKQGGLFTIEPSYAASTELALDEVSKAVSAKMMEPMTAPMMALSLLSNTSFLIDHGVMNLTLPRLPLMYPGDPTAQDKCLEAVDMVIQTLKEVRDEASNLYVDLQSALLRASVKHYLTSDGTLWDSMPLKKELRDATYGMAFALVLIVNQVLSHATPSVQTLMGRLCQVIVAALHELLTANIRVMSAAALASLFLEMNFIEGIIPSSLKNDKFDESIEQSYELMLRRLLELVKRKPPSSSSQLAQLLKNLRNDGSEMDQMESLHGCLEAYATKVLPAHAQRANMHFDCFKALTTDDGGGRKKPKAKVVPVWQKSRPKVHLRAGRAGTNSMANNGEYDKELLDSLVKTMTGKLEAMFAEDEDE